MHVARLARWVPQLFACFRNKKNCLSTVSAPVTLSARMRACGSSWYGTAQLFTVHAQAATLLPLRWYTCVTSPRRARAPSNRVRRHRRQVCACARACVRARARVCTAAPTPSRGTRGSLTQPPNDGHVLVVANARRAVPIAAARAGFRCARSRAAWRSPRRATASWQREAQGTSHAARRPS